MATDDGDTTAARRRTRRDEATTPIVNVPAPLERALADLRRDARAGDAAAATLLNDVERVLADAPACDRGRPRGVEPKRMPIRIADLAPSWPATEYGVEVGEGA